MVWEGFIVEERESSQKHLESPEQGEKVDCTLPAHCIQHTASSTLQPAHCIQHTAASTLQPAHCMWLPRAVCETKKNPGNRD